MGLMTSGRLCMMVEMASAEVRQESLCTTCSSSNVPATASLLLSPSPCGALELDPTESVESFGRKMG